MDPQLKSIVEAQDFGDLGENHRQSFAHLPSIG